MEGSISPAWNISVYFLALAAAYPISENGEIASAPRGAGGYHGLDVLEFPSAPAEDRSGVRSYLNYLETDEAVFLPVFGIDTDTKAIAAAEKLFSKPVEPVMIPHLAADGSGLHSISWGMSY